MGRDAGGARGRAASAAFRWRGRQACVTCRIATGHALVRLDGCMAVPRRRRCGICRHCVQRRDASRPFWCSSDALYNRDRPVSCWECFRISGRGIANTRRRLAVTAAAPRALGSAAKCTAVAGSLGYRLAPARRGKNSWRAQTPKHSVHTQDARAVFNNTLVSSFSRVKVAGKRQVAALGMKHAGARG